MLQRVTKDESRNVDCIRASLKLKKYKVFFIIKYKIKLGLPHVDSTHYLSEKQFHQTFHQHVIVLPKGKFLSICEFLTDFITRIMIFILLFCF